MAFKTYSNGIMYSHGEVEDKHAEISRLKNNSNERFEIIDDFIDAIELYLEQGDRDELIGIVKFWNNQKENMKWEN